MIKSIIAIGLAIIALALAYLYITPKAGTQVGTQLAPTGATQPTPNPVSTTTTPTDTHGMKQYTDAQYGFSFWYPQEQAIVSNTKQDTKNFPGGTVMETIRIGEQGGTQLFVVQSPESTITDEPNGHASPIAQTKYFYDHSGAQWMVAYPEGQDTANSTGTTTADVSNTTIGNLPQLQSGRRFDTTIIPINTTTFVIVTDGGGSGFTKQLAHTIAPIGAVIDPAALSATLQAESDAATTR